MSDAGDFVDAALHYEASRSGPRADIEQASVGLRFYGASVGAVRATVRNAVRRYPHLDHDEITRLSSELWAVPVFERRQAAIVLLQVNVALLGNSDLTRIEGFVRTAGSPHLVDVLVADVLVPMLTALDVAGRARAGIVLQRWAADEHESLRRVAALVQRPT